MRRPLKINVFAFDSVPWKFGLITCVAGLLGVMIGAEAGRRLRRKYGNADPLVCAFGLVGSAPCFCLAIYLADKNTAATWVSALELLCPAILVFPTCLPNPSLS